MAQQNAISGQTNLFYAARISQVITPMQALVKTSEDLVKIGRDDPNNLSTKDQNYDEIPPLEDACDNEPQEAVFILPGKFFLPLSSSYLTFLFSLTLRRP